MSSFVLQKDSDHEIDPKMFILCYGGGRRGIHSPWNFDLSALSANFVIPKMVKMKCQVLESKFCLYVNHHKSMEKF